MATPKGAHGFDDDAETRRLLRSPPTSATLEWVAAAVGSEVAKWTVLRGGTSSAMYALDFAGTATPRLVLRCYVRADLDEEEPDLVEREEAALRVAAPLDIASPKVVATDATGSQAGVPAVLMTWLPGRVRWDPKGSHRWLDRLAALLPAIHQADTSAEDLGAYFNYRQSTYEPPGWAQKPQAWEKAVEIFHGPILDPARCFIHRDFHPGNVLWHRARVSGVVDWQSACVGPPSVDVGHCRANFLRYAPELAEAFTEMAEAHTGRAFHPWADIAALIGMLDGLREQPPRPIGRRAIERAIESAVAHLA